MALTLGGESGPASRPEEFSSPSTFCLQVLEGFHRAPHPPPRDHPPQGNYSYWPCECFRRLLDHQDPDSIRRVMEPAEEGLPRLAGASLY